MFVPLVRLVLLVLLGGMFAWAQDPPAGEGEPPPEAAPEARADAPGDAPAEGGPKVEPPAPAEGVPAIPGKPKPPKTAEKKATDTTRPTKRPPDREMGRNLYHQSCWQCHGKTGRGDGPAAALLVGGVPSLEGRIRSKGAEDLEDMDALVAAVQDGKGRMPAYAEDVDKIDSRRVLLYIRDALEGREGGAPEGEEAEEDGDGPGGEPPAGQ